MLLQITLLYWRTVKPQLQGGVGWGRVGVGAAGWVIPACELTALHASRQHLFNFVATLFLYCVIVAAAPPASPITPTFFLPLWQVSMKLMVWSVLQPALHLHHSTPLWAYRRGLDIATAVFFPLVPVCVWFRLWAQLFFRASHLNDVWDGSQKSMVTY